MIHINCPVCREQLNIPEEYAGKTGRCNFCGGAISVPTATVAGGEDIVVVEPVSGVYATPRRPTRPGAGMIANEVEYGGNSMFSLGRVVLLSCLVLAVTACILPALVIGYSTETKPEGPDRPRIVPTARGEKKDIVPLVQPLVAVEPSAPAPHVAPLEDGKRIVYITSGGTTYHRADCPLLSDGKQATTLRTAIERKLSPCPDCGG